MDILSEDLYRNLFELDLINKWLGGYRVSISGLNKIIKKQPACKNLLDIGFGGGDAIKQLSLYGQNNKIILFFYGVDLKPDCTLYATKNLLNINNKKLICDDYRNISKALLEKIDIVHCSLFIHHLTDNEIIDLFQFCKNNKCILLINDLHRHWLAYHSIKIITRIFSRSFLIKNDAPLSVKRGFKKLELTSLIKKGGYTNYEVKWAWAFRYRLIAYS